MIRKLAMIGVLSATALAGCATYGSSPYANGRGDYYYGYPQTSSRVGVSVGSGYYGYPGGYYNGYYGYPSYGYGYPSYGYPPYPNRPHKPRPPRPGSADTTPNRKPGWQDLDNIRRQQATGQAQQIRPQARPGVERVVPQRIERVSGGDRSGSDHRRDRPRKPPPNQP